MLKSTGILITEHRLIRQALDHLSVAQERLEMDERPPPEFFQKAIDFFQNFADKCHHFKEEYLLFGLLAQKKKGDLDTEIGMLRYEHDRCRGYVKGMKNVLAGYEDNDAIATVTLLENLAPYIALLKRHIHKEDAVFFRMADREISETEDQRLVERFSHDGNGPRDDNDVMAIHGALVLEMAELVKN